MQTNNGLDLTETLTAQEMMQDLMDQGYDLDTAAEITAGLLAS